MPIATVNPANGETLRTFDALDDDEIEKRIAAPTPPSATTAPPHSANGPGCSAGPPTCWTRTGGTSPAP